MNKNDRPPLVSLIILNWNGHQHLARCLPSLLAIDYPRYELIVVDNSSTDDSVAFVRENFPNVQVIVNERNLGFSAGMNVGLRYAQGDIIVLLNNDVYVRPDWLGALIRPLVEDELVGITGGKLLFPDEHTIQHAGAALTYPLAYSYHYGYGENDHGQYDQLREVDYVTGAAMAVTRKLLTDIGLLDEGFSPFFFEEPDLCRRARVAGYRVIYVPDAVAIHYEGASFAQKQDLRLYAYHKSRLRYVLKHYTLVEFFNDFLPAETKCLTEWASPEDLQVARHSYLEAMLMLPELCRSRTTASEMERIREALEELRKVALQRRITIYGSMPNEWYIQELIARQVPKEPVFHSNVPVIGGLIAGFRETWNSVSTKWYVRPILQQQVSFNQLAAAILTDLSSQAGANARDISRLAGELIEMDRRFAIILSQMQEELDDLRDRLDRIEAMSAHDRELV